MLRKQSRALSILLAVLMVIALTPYAGFAEGTQPDAGVENNVIDNGDDASGIEGNEPGNITDPEGDITDPEGGTVHDIYVHVDGNDTNDGSKDHPYATLSKAVDAAQSGAVIYVMSDLTINKCARFYNKDLTITSYVPEEGAEAGSGAPYTITRAENFLTQSDNARSWYNPAMIEVAGTPVKALEGEAETDTETDTGAEAAAEAESSNGNTEGRQLGHSSLRIENLILDDEGRHAGTEFDFAKTNNSSVDNREYVQDSIIASYDGTGDITLGEGAVLKNFGGMSAVYLTGGSKLIMESGSKICDDKEDIGEGRKGKHAVHLISSELDMNEGSYIRDLKKSLAINAEEKSKVSLSGIVTGINGNSNPLIRIVKESEFILGRSGSIEKNITNNIATMYVQSGSTADLYGRIAENEAPCGAVFIVTNGGDSHVTMYDGAEIVKNISTTKYGVVELQQGNCTFIMEGGLISENNSGNSEGGGAVQIRKDNARFVMNGGSIVNNTLNDESPADAGVFMAGGNNITAELNGGTLQSIKLNNGPIGNTEYGHIFISKDFNLETGHIEYVKDSKNISPLTGSRDIRLSNASKEQDAALAAESADKGWSNPIATFWVQRGEGKAKLNVSNIDINPKLPVYVLTIHKPEINDNPGDQNGGNQGDDNPNGNDQGNENQNGDNPNGNPNGDNQGDENQNGDNPNGDAQPANVRALAEISPVEADGIFNCYVGEIIEEIVSADGDEWPEYSVDVDIPESDLAGDGCAVAIVQPEADYGSLTITGPSRIREKTGDQPYQVKYTVRYIMSESMKNIIDNLPEGAEVTYILSMNPDGRLEAPEDMLDEYQLGEKIDKENGIVEIEYVLPHDKFEIGKILETSAVLTIEIEHETTYITVGDDETPGTINPPGNNTPDDNQQDAAQAFRYIIPSNIAETEMLRRSSGGGGGNNGGDGGTTIIDPDPVPLGPAPPSDLNSEDHFAYIFGFDDETVRPEENITRAQTATMLYRLLKAERRDEIFTDKNSFSDVSSDMWYNKAVSSMVKGKYITGYQGGTFDGNRNITRAEFVTMLARFTESVPAEMSFTDVGANHWAYESIGIAANNEWLTGYPDGTFRPEQPITRAEAMAIINRVLNRGVDSSGVLTGFKNWKDNNASAWYYWEIIEATNDHTYSGSRPAEKWLSLKSDYVYDIDKYERP